MERVRRYLANEWLSLRLWWHLLAVVASEVVLAPLFFAYGGWCEIRAHWRHEFWPEVTETWRHFLRAKGE